MAKNNTPLNIEKVVSFIKEDIFSKEYHCPYTDAAIVLETLRKLHEEHDLKWIEQAARYYALYSHNLLQDEEEDPQYHQTAYRLYTWISEGSRYLQTVYPEQLAAKREEMEQYIESLRARRNALNLIKDKQADSFIRTMLYKLQASDYLLYASHKIEMFLYFLAYDKSLLRKQLPIIAETIYLLKKNGVISDNHNATLQNILKLEIEQYEIIISELWHTNAQCVLQTKIEEAIHLIVLSLLSNKVPFEETDNTRILSARIYRYLSRLDTPFSSQLKNKAYTMLTGESSLEKRLDWEHLLNFELNRFIAQMVNIRIDELNMPAEPQDNKWKQYSNGHNTLTLDKDGFTLSTLFPHSTHTWKGRKERAALMENRVFIALFSKPTYLFNNCKSIAELQLYWHQLTEDYPLYERNQPESPQNSSILETSFTETKDSNTKYPSANEEITIGIIGPDRTRQYLEGVILDEQYRGVKAILPLTQINACYFCIENFENYFSSNDTYKVKVLSSSNEGVRVSLASRYNEFVYAENVKRKKIPAMIADCEGNKIKWLLITGATSTTPINRWIKPRVGDIYQVEFPDNNTFLNNNINIGKVKADISVEAFYQEVHTHLQEFFTHLREYQNNTLERQIKEQTLKLKNNPFVNALQKIDIQSVLSSDVAETYIMEEEQETEEKTKKSGKAENKTWPINEEVAKELIFCLDQLSKELNEPNEQFNAYNFLRLLCLFSGEKEKATYYGLCAEYIYNINQIAILPSGERFSHDNIQRFNILLARMEQLGIKQYGITFEFCQKIVHILSLMADNNTDRLKQLMQSEDLTIAELARYFCMSTLLSKEDTELQHIIYKNINSLLGIKEQKKEEAPSIPVYFGHEGVEREFKSSAFGHAKKDAREDQSMVLARVIASFMNTDGGTLYIGVNDKGYLTGIQEDLKLVHNDCDIYLRTVNHNIICLLGEGKEDYNRYQEYIRCNFQEYGKERIVLAFRVAPINEVVKVSGKIYTRSGSSCICKPEQNIHEFIAARRNLKLDSVARKPEFPTLFSAERNEYIFDESAPVTATPDITENNSHESISLSLFDNPQEESINAPGPVIAVPTTKKKKATFNIQTSVLRPNPLQKKTELGYNSNFQFISFFNNGKIAGSTSPKIGIWGEDSGKVICSYDTEGDEELLVSVFKTGEIGISNLKKGFSQLNSPIVFVDNVNELFFCSPASKDKFLLLIAEKDGVKRYRIIRLSDFDKPLGIQPKLYTLLVPDKGNYIFAEILDKNIMGKIEDDKITLNSFDQYNAGHYWEHTSYKNGLDTISKLCNLPY